MSFLEKAALTVEAIFVLQEQIKAALENDWPEFKVKLLAALQDLAQAEENQIDYLMSELLFLAWGTPAFPIFRRIMQVTKEGSSLMEVSRSISPFTAEPDKHLSTISLNAFRVGVQRMIQAISSGRAIVEGQGVKEIIEFVSVPQRIVSTGFATFDHPEEGIDRYLPLTVDQPSYFWLEIGKKILAGNIEREDIALPINKLPPSARLDIVLFGYENEIIITSDQDSGGLQVTSQGVRVIRPVARPPALMGNDLLTRRLYFPVRTPAQPGIYRLRCHIYYQQTLVQARLITAKVMLAPIPQDAPALKSEVDYTLSKTLSAQYLHGMGQNRLSLMLNNNSNDTHGFRFYGKQPDGYEFKRSASLSAGMLQNLTDMMRNVLRKASWGNEDPYSEEKEYRYEGGLNMQRLREDLTSFALKGYRFYDVLIDQMTGGVQTSRALQKLMAEPGQIQIALKEFVQFVLPAAMIYDYPLYDGLKTDEYALCLSFVESLNAKTPLENTPCFQGNCPSKGNKNIICPSGFWGYRHSLGLPVSVANAADAPFQILSSNKPGLAVGVCTDPKFVNRQQHERTLHSMGVEWEYADSLEQTVTMLKNTRAQVVYFYCHGGLQNDLPYLLLGDLDSDRFTRALLRTEEIYWQEVRPLVIINGCHTTALEPEKALDLVSGFVQTSQASGVIGTEIAIFEPTAVSFAEAFFRRFLPGEQTVGESVRGARLEMLKAGNPLGLVYISYVLPGLRLVKQQMAG